MFCCKFPLQKYFQIFLRSVNNTQSNRKNKKGARFFETQCIKDNHTLGLFVFPQKWSNVIDGLRQCVILDLASLVDMIYYVCASHFDCEWVVSRGGRRPSAPPSVSPGIAKSCLKQCEPPPLQNE